MQTIKRNIIIRPAITVSDQAIIWSRQIAARYKTTFVLDGKQFFPHITLYQAAYPDKNLSKVVEQIAKIVKQIKPLRIHGEKFSSLVGFIFLKAVINRELISLHQQIVSLCNPLREGVIPPEEAPNLTNPNVPEFIKSSIRTYGSALAMEAFMPHITLSRVQNPEEAEAAAAILTKPDISFDVYSIYEANIGPDGTVNEIFKEFPFQMI